MIHLTCENCQTIYQLDATKLGAAGRKVRCGQCKTVWFQEPVEDPDAPAETVDTFDVSDDGDDFSLDDKVAESVSDAREDATAEEEADKPEWLRVNEAVEGDLDFLPAEKNTESGDSGEETDASHDESEDRQDVFTLPEDFGEGLSPLQQQTFQIPVMTHRPMGMGAVQFGIFTFLLLSFSSLLGLIALRGVIMHHAPVMDALYRPIGLAVKAPGEGLKLSGFTARDMPAKGQHTLSITAELSNTTQSVIDWPPFRIEALDDKDVVVKEWLSSGGADGGAQEGQTVAANTALPLQLSFNDAPDHVKKVRIIAVGP